MATIPASENVFPLVRLAEGAAPSTPPTGEAHLYVKGDGLLYWKDDAGTEYAAGGDVAAHLADAADAHDASAISVLDAAANFTGTDVEAVLAELAAAAGGSGGWDLAIDQDGSSIADWTARDGTWASTSGEIRQTGTGASEFNLHHTASTPPMALVLAECEVWIPSGNATDDYIGMDLGIDAANSANTGIRVYLKRTGTSLLVATIQGGAETVQAAVTVNVDTWYKIRALAAGNRVSVWLDGTFKFSAVVTPNSLTDATYFGLFTALSTGHFRNVKVWTPTLPA